MVKVAVCDDEKEITTELKLALVDIFDGLGVVYEIDGFFSVSELRRSLKAGTCYDLIFLDIAFSENEINGVEMGWLIREVFKDNAVSIIYISWVERYAVHLFKIRPIDFLIKPLTREKVKVAVEAYLRIAGPLEREFAYKKGRSMHSVRTKDIVYMEARDRKVVIHFCNGEKDDFYGALKDVYEKDLKERDFLFVHASFAVNCDYVAAIKFNDLHIVGWSSPLPISQNRKNEVRERYAAIMKRRRVQ